MHFFGVKRALFTEINGESEKALYPRSDMAYPSEIGFAFHGVNHLPVSELAQYWGVQALGRKTIESGESHQLREPSIQYVAHFGVKKSDIGSKNTYPSHCFSHIGLVKWLSP